jgi:hypothetical protein
MHSKLRRMRHEGGLSANRGARLPTGDFEHVDSQDLADALKELIDRREQDVWVRKQIMGCAP